MKNSIPIILIRKFISNGNRLLNVLTNEEVINLYASTYLFMKIVLCQQKEK